MKHPGEGTFIPCGDSFEKMEEILDNELEQVSGGVEGIVPTVPVYIPEKIGILYGKHNQE